LYDIYVYAEPIVDVYGTDGKGGGLCGGAVEEEGDIKSEDEALTTANDEQ